MPMISAWIPLAPAKSRYAKEPGGTLKKFKYTELEKVTLNFHPSNLIGKNSYKGVITNDYGKKEVVVKNLSGLQAKNSREWVREITSFEEIEHPNLAKIVGYCAKGNKRKKFEIGRYFIVYEFMKNGSVHDHLSDHTSLHGPLAWKLRLKIARDSARALAYLHGKQIVHKFFSSSSVLLDNKFHVKVCDYLVSRLGPIQESEENNFMFHDFSVHGRPKSFDRGMIRPKHDILSFGILLCELITGSDKMRTENEHRVLVEKHFSDAENLKTVIDPTLRGTYDIETVKALANIAKMCLRKDPEFPPSMKTVAAKLSGIAG